MVKTDVGCDVKVVNYDTIKGRVSNINFYKDIEQLIDANRVKLNLRQNRLYFTPVCYKKKGTFKLSNHSLQIATKDVVAFLEYFIGTYQLEFDSVKNMYYIENSDVSDILAVQEDMKNEPKKAEVNNPHKVVVKKPIRSAVTDNNVKEENVSQVKDAVVKSNKQNESIIAMLDILDTYDTNDAVYSAGHTLIQTIKEMLQQ